MADHSGCKRKPLISIIIPAYNMAERIERCLVSIIGQMSDELEVIVVDDGSTDKTGDVVRRIVSENAHVRYLSLEHAGASSARNAGIDLAAGDYLMFIDADDEIEAHYLQNIVDKAKSSDADILIWGIKRCHSDGWIEERKPDLDGEYDRVGFLKSFPYEQYGCKKGLYGYVSNKLVKSSIVHDFNLRFDPVLNVMEDFDFFLGCYSKCSRFLCFSETGYRYVVNDGPIHNSLPKEVSYPQLITVQTKCADLLKEEGAWTQENEHLLLKAIGDLSLSMFLEMKRVDYSSVKSNLGFIRENQYCIPALRNLETQWKMLRRLILDRNTLGVMAFSAVWNTYMHVRTGGRR